MGKSGAGVAHWRLGAMFGLQNMMWGAQVILLSGHLAELGFSGREISYVLATSSLAALCSPLLAGWLADRYWPAESFAGYSYLLCAPLLWAAWRHEEFLPLWGILFAFSLLHAPMMGLTNAIAFGHVGDTRRFARIRTWGSIGWVGISWAVSAYLWLWERAAPGESHLGDGLLIAGGLSLLMGLYCFTLPRTLPQRTRGRPLAFTGAFSLLRQRDFAVLMVTAFIVSAMSPFSYNFSFIFFVDAVHGPGFKDSSASWILSLGQLAEIGLIPCLGLLIARLGLRWTIFSGMLAAALRSLIFALGGPMWLLVFAQALNGYYITCFIVAGTIAVERLSPDDLRASAQSLLVLCIRGLGPLLGHLLAGAVYDYYALADGGRDWGAIFLVPSLVSLGGALCFAWWFSGSAADGAGGRPRWSRRRIDGRAD